MYYCIVLLYCIIVLYYCIVWLCCIIVLYYCIVLFSACEQVIHTGCNVIQGVCQCGDSCTHSFEFADRETCLNSVKSQGNWNKNQTFLFYIYAFRYQGTMPMLVLMVGFLIELSHSGLSPAGVEGWRAPGNTARNEDSALRFFKLSFISFMSVECLPNSPPQPKRSVSE